MDISSLFSKGLLIKSSFALYGVSGISLGSWQFYGSNDGVIGNVFGEPKRISGSNLNLDHNLGGLESYKKIMENENNSCCSLYFKKDPFNISIDKLTQPSNSKNIELKNLNLSKYNFGCAIFKNTWAEIVLWKNNSSESILLYFHKQTTLEIFIFNSEKSGEITSSEFQEQLDIYNICFYYKGEKINGSDWILKNGKNIKITMTISEYVNAEIKMEGDGWEKVTDL